MQNPWVVHKFGGTSVANSARFETVIKIIKRETAPKVAIVVSAMSGVTNGLIELIELAKRQDSSYQDKLEILKQKHFTTIDELLGMESALGQDLRRVIDADSRTILDLLKAVQLSRSYSETTLEMISGFGELWSAQMLNARMLDQGEDSQWLDARKVLIVSHGETGPSVDWDLSREKLLELLSAKSDRYLVITGYIASTLEGVPTTLKRNGSDFSASIFGALLDATSITIWTDVDGVLSADPRRVPEAVVLDEMSYQEAMELAYFGAKVIHPQTMAPAQKMGVPLWIRNTLNPDLPGTKIHHPSKEMGHRHPVKGFTTIDEVALLNLEGTMMIGVPGIASRLFSALKEVGVSVIMISQASSEHSICFAVPAKQGALAKTTIDKAFFSEIHQGLIQSVECVTGVSVLAAVGDQMVNVPGVAAKFFRALSLAGVSIRAIAQGSSERNISVVVDQAQATRALRAAHAGFYLSAQTLSIGVLGPGLIGSALLQQLKHQARRLREDFKIDLRVRGVCDSNYMLLGERLEFNSSPKDRLKSEGAPIDLSRFANHIQAEHVPHSVIIDCTSSEMIASHYREWLGRGIHIVTPNKKAGSGPLKDYLEIRGMDQEKGSHYLYEATVGAGLPIITTLRDLIRTGDEVIEIEGVLSGTLSYLFNQFSSDRSFSAVVLEAQKLGYTEPDPRDDLSGLDVARKLIILGREIGMKLEMKDIEIESLVPVRLRTLKSASEFLNALPESDSEMMELQHDAEKNDSVLRYVGSVSPDGQACVKLKRYPKVHPFARLRATDNIIAIKTKRYHSQPLIIQGPGAGPEVTAGGVFGDVLRLAGLLG